MTFALRPRRPGRLRPLDSARDQRGSLSVEMVILVPVFVIMLGLMVAGGRLWVARTTVAEAAYSGARAASLARTATQGGADGREAVIDQLDTKGLDCLGRSIDIDTGAFAEPVGQPATISAEVDCRIGFSDVLLPGMPGSITVHGKAQSALDTYRER